MTREELVALVGEDNVMAVESINCEMTNRKEEKKMTITCRLNGKTTENTRIRGIIEAAPGFTGEGTYDVLRTKSGGYRVFKVVGDRAMDASLKDIPGEILEGMLRVQAAELAGATWMESVLTECDDPDEWLVMDYQEFLQAVANANRHAFPDFESGEETDAAYQGAWDQLEFSRRLHAADKVYQEDLEKRKMEGWKDYDGK